MNKRLQLLLCGASGILTRGKGWALQVQALAYLARRVPRKLSAKRLAIFCGLYAATAFALFPSSYIAAFGETRMMRFYVLFPLLAFQGLAIASIAYRPKAPLSFLVEKISGRGGADAGLAIVLFMVCLAAFTAFKHNFSTLVPFFADPLLADLDAAMHIGDPWRWARALPFAPWMDWTLYVLYSHLWIVQLAAGVVVAAFVEDKRVRLRYFLSLTATAILLGVAVRLGFSSAGPIFYDRMFDGDRFADLIEALRSSAAGPSVLRISDYLFSSFALDRASVGTGISAMPSFHIAIAVLNALFIRKFGRWVGFLAWTYAAVIMFGSVYFGWHYALDGYVSIAAVLGIWAWAGRVAGKT